MRPLNVEIAFLFHVGLSWNGFDLDFDNFLSLSFTNFVKLFDKVLSKRTFSIIFPLFFVQIHPDL